MCAALSMYHCGLACAEATAPTSVRHCLAKWVVNYTLQMLYWEHCDVLLRLHSVPHMAARMAVHHVGQGFMHAFVHACWMEQCGAGGCAWGHCPHCEELCA